ncbi:hypothetical protein DPSP01_014201 [Paraphaeosphaeria sporulosa]
MSPPTLSHISDPESSSFKFPKLEKNEWQRLARTDMTLIIRWHHKGIRLGTGHHSVLQLTETPWATETPFDLRDLLLQAKIFRPSRELHRRLFQGRPAGKNSRMTILS